MENQNDQVLVTRKTELTGAQKAGYLFAGLLGGAGCCPSRRCSTSSAPRFHRYDTSGKTGDAGEKSGAAKIGLERAIQDYYQQMLSVISKCNLYLTQIDIN